MKIGAPGTQRPIALNQTLNLAYSEAFAEWAQK
jgi:hypothetical protein